MSSNIPTKQQIKDMLQEHKPYSEIEEKCKVSSKSIAAIAKEAGLVRRHRISKTQGGKPVSGPSPQDPSCDPRILAHLKFLNEFFKANSDHIFANPTIVKYIEENADKFDEVENLCQA